MKKKTEGEGCAPAVNEAAEEESRKRLPAADSMKAQEGNGHDPFALEQGISPFIDGVDEILHVTVGKPGEVVFRIHPSSAYQARYGIFKRREEGVVGDVHRLVHPRLKHFFAHTKRYRTYIVYSGKTIRGQFFLWPIPAIDEGGFASNLGWYKSAHRAARIAMEEPVCLISGDNSYFVRRPKNLPHFDPKFEEYPPFEKLRDLAFEGLVIESEQDPVIEELEGEIVQLVK